MWCPRLRYFSRHREVSKPREGLCYGALATFDLYLRILSTIESCAEAPDRLDVWGGGGCEGRELALFQAIR